MKFVAILFVAILAMVAGKSLKEESVNIQDVELILKGVIEGLFEGEFPIEDCIQDGEEIFEDFEKAYYYLKKGVSIKHIKEAFEFMKDAVQKLPKTIYDCESCTGIVDELKTIAEIFSNPIHALEMIGKNVFFHRKEITSDIFKAIGNWEAEQYEEFGSFVGKIVAIALGANEPLTSSYEDVFDFLVHFYDHAFGIELKFVNCDDAGQVAYDIIVEAYTLYSLGDMTQAITYVMANMDKIPDAFSHCRSCYEELVEGVDDMKKLQSISHTVESFNNAFKHHPIAMPLDVKKGIDAYNAHDWPKLADNAGEVMSFMLEEA